MLSTIQGINAKSSEEKSAIISIISGGIGTASATINNNGAEDLHNIQWMINVKTRKTTGPQVFDITSKGIIPILKPDYIGEKISILIPSGFTIVKITIKIQPENEEPQEAIVPAILIGKLLICP